MLMFYFWQGYLMRKIGEGIYKNSLYYHYKFSVHLKLFQNKFGIFFFLITIEHDLLLWSKQQTLDGIPVASGNIGETLSIFIQAKERIPIKWHDKGVLWGHQVQGHLQEMTCISGTPRLRLPNQHFMVLDHHHSTVCSFGHL